jgi:hypothetical protein
MMKRGGFRLAALVGAALLPAACAEDDAPNQASYATDETANSGYFVVTQVDERRCAWPGCGGLFVKLASMDKTMCASGVENDHCYVAQIDFSELGLSEEQQSNLHSQSEQLRVVVRGDLVRRDGPLGQHPVLVAREAHVLATAGASSGELYLVSSVDVTCVTWPCPPHFSEQGLNLPEGALVDDVSLAELLIHPAIRPRIYEGLAGDGVIIAGEHVIHDGFTRTARTLVAKGVYLEEVPITTDPCESVDLPLCPDECPGTQVEVANTACSDEGAVCGNELGDGCECIDGRWACSVTSEASADPGECALACAR